MLGLIKRLIGSSQERIIKKISKIVETVNQYDLSYQNLSDQLLKSKTQEFQSRYAAGESLDSLLPEAYGVVKSVCRRLCGTQIAVSGYTQEWDMIPYDVQIIGAIAMHMGFIAEMQTGEGKTLTATMPLYLHALTGRPVHLVTVNDYLAARDASWVGEILRWLGISTGVLSNGTPLSKRKEVYSCGVVYGTASEFGFDYLRDNSLAKSKEELVQRGHYFSIIDEIDSILIDEARTPLIISAPALRSNPTYQDLKDSVTNLVKMQRDLCNHISMEVKQSLDKYLSQDELPKDKKQQEQISLLCNKLWLVSKGMPLNKFLRRVREHPDLRALIDKWDIYYHADQNKEEAHEKLSQLFLVLDEKSNDFELTDKGIHTWNNFLPKATDDFVMLDLGYEYAVIDEDNTLSLEDKLKRKIAIRELDSNKKSRVHALRQLLRAHLLMEKDKDYIIENGKVIIIDEHTGRPQPGRRFSDGLHQAIEAKEGVVINQETQTHATITLQNYFRLYEKCSGMTGTAITEAQEFKEIYNLNVLQIPTFKPCHRIDFHDEFYMTEREKYTAIVREIIEIHRQGRPILIGTESVEVSEKLSRILRQNHVSHNVLNAKNHVREAEIIAKAGVFGAVTVATNMAGRGTDIKLDKEAENVGGLHVISTTRHSSRRIDRQLRGRCARLGDPGSSKFFLSFEDELMRLFSSPKINALIQHFRPPEGESISDKMLNRLIETAQKRVEARNYSIRKHTLEYDDVMNKQRQEIYRFRSDVLLSTDMFTFIKSLLEDACDIGIYEICSVANKIDLDRLSTWISESFPVNLTIEQLKHHDGDNLVEFITGHVIAAFDKKCQLIKRELLQIDDSLNTNDVIQEMICSLIVSQLDKLWQEHLLEMDLLRSEVNLRTIGQKDPLIEFKYEAFSLFTTLVQQLKVEIACNLFRVQLVEQKDN